MGQLFICLKMSKNYLYKKFCLFCDNFEFEIDNHIAVEFHPCGMFTNLFDRIFLDQDLFTINFEPFFS